MEENNFGPKRTRRARVFTIFMEQRVVEGKNSEQEKIANTFFHGATGR